MKAAQPLSVTIRQIEFDGGEMGAGTAMNAATAVALWTSTGYGTSHAQSSWSPAPSAIGRRRTDYPNLGIA
jgi:hypothetical protein